MAMRILLVDDHKIMRDGLRVLLEKQPDIEVAGEAENGRMAVRMARELPADMVIMDIGMPDLNGIDATREIVASVPGVKVIALSMHSDKVFVGEMFKAGASAYLLKHCAFEELAQAIRVVSSGQFYLSPQIAGPMIKDYVRQMSNDNTSVFAVLTVREREVLQLLAEGKSIQTNRFSPQYQFEDRGNSPAADHGEAEHRQHGRSDQTRHPRRTYLPRSLTVLSALILRLNLIARLILHIS